MRKYDNLEFPDGLIKRRPHDDLRLVIVIPAYMEPTLHATVQSLYDNLYDEGAVEIIVLLNQSDKASTETTAFHTAQYKQLLELAKKSPREDMALYPVFVKDIPYKIAGAGIARKTGMDEAYRRLALIGNNIGIIASLDADTLVDPNYIEELLKEASGDTKIKAYSIYFEHDLNSVSGRERDAIIQYELHLRYYVNMQRLLRLPFAYYTVGSAMAVRAYAYAEAFGMNKRQAGEDFYFLHKFIKTGYFKEINSTTVYPAARISERVPFGTGKAISKIIQSGSILKTYHYNSFLLLQDMTDNLDILYDDFDLALDRYKDPLKEFLPAQGFKRRYDEIKSNTKDFAAFKKRFFRWFDAFKLMKYLHFMRDNYYENITVDTAVDFLMRKLTGTLLSSLEESLLTLRKIDKNGYL